MKKLLAGCLVVVVLAGVALGIAVYLGYRAARPMIDGAAAWMAQARELAAESDRLTNRAEFVAPDGGMLDEPQVRRFLAVQSRVRETLGSRWETVRARARALDDGARAGERAPSLSELGTLLSEFGDLMLAARRAHVDAMNAEGFSSAEYAWVRTRVYEAAGLELADRVDWTALERMVEDGAAQAGVEAPPLRLPDIPDINRSLVRPHVDALRDWMPLAALGF